MTDSERIVDARGRELRLADPRRVVSLVPSLTETLFELGLGARLAGRTRYCVHPADDVAGVPVFGGTKDPDLDGIIAARPDLVLVCLEENKPEHLEAMEAAGVALHAVHPRSLADVRRLLGDYGRLFGAGEAVAELLAEFDAAEAEAAAFRQRLLGGRERAPRAATLIWREPWMASGSGTYIHAMMAALGLDDAFAARRDYFETSLDQLRESDLDLLFLPDEPYPFSEREAEELVTAGALARGRESVLFVEGELLTWYGSRTPRALRELVLLLGERLAPASKPSKLRTTRKET